MDLSVEKKKLFWCFVRGTYKKVVGTCGASIKQKFWLQPLDLWDDRRWRHTSSLSAAPSRRSQNRLSRKWSRLWRVLDMKLWIGDILGCLVDFGIFEVNDIIVIHDHSLSTVLKIERKSYKVLNSILAILCIGFVVGIKVYLVQSDRNRFNWILKLQIKFLIDTGIFFCD